MTAAHDSLSPNGTTDYRRGWSEAKSPVTIPQKSNPDGVTDGIIKNCIYAQVNYLITICYVETRNPRVFLYF